MGIPHSTLSLSPTLLPDESLTTAPWLKTYPELLSACKMRFKLISLACKTLPYLTPILSLAPPSSADTEKHLISPIHAPGFPCFLSVLKLCPYNSVSPSDLHVQILSTLQGDVCAGHHSEGSPLSSDFHMEVSIFDLS